MGLNPSGWASVIWELLPSGPLWSSLGERFDSMVDVGAAELARVDTAADEAEAEAYPDTASSTLSRWLAIFGLSTVGDSARDTNRLMARVNDDATPTEPTLRELLAPSLGMDPAAIPFVQLTSEQAKATLHQEYVYELHIVRDPDLPGAYSIEDAQEIADALTHAHDRIVICERQGFFCDDPHSLTDRDILRE